VPTAIGFVDRPRKHQMRRVARRRRASPTSRAYTFSACLGTRRRRRAESSEDGCPELFRVRVTGRRRVEPVSTGGSRSSHRPRSPDPFGSPEMLYPSSVTCIAEMRDLACRHLLSPTRVSATLLSGCGGRSVTSVAVLPFERLTDPLRPAFGRATGQRDRGEDFEALSPKKNKNHTT